MNDPGTTPTARPAPAGGLRTSGASRSRKRRLGRAGVPAALAFYVAVLGAGVALDVQAAEPRPGKSVKTLDVQVPDPQVPDQQPAESVKALDSDNAITDPAWFTQAYAEGFRLYIMASTEFNTCIPLDRTQAQLGMALEAGLKIAVYTRDPNCWEVGITSTGPFQDQLQFFALDFEWGGSGITREMVDGIRDKGVRPVIYSGHAMWPEIMGAAAGDFSDVPLWDADIGPLDYATWTPDHLSPAPVPYGGWNTPSTMRIGIQHHLGSWNGVNVDLNSFDASFLE